MDLQEQVDLQCKKIADGLVSLKQLLDQDLARRVLELDSSLDSGRNFDQLLRLKRSLLQYLERKGDVLYVGFMGHFSSGKSSTINSLLNLWNSKHAREVDLNPTDKDITLITHPKNSKSLIGLKNEGLIPVRTTFIENDLLMNMVIADTPGSGDPLLLNEMVRDFLPVCDIILYFFSAATALTDADTPLLENKTKKLAFIPMRFIVTRADEFKRDISEPFSKGNYNNDAADYFLTQLASRISKIIGAPIHKNQDFLIIDNRSSFNIQSLANFLSDQSNVQDSSKRVIMHGHKVNYFVSHSLDIQAYFNGLLDRKIEVLQRIVDHAKLNISRYQDKVQITNNKLTEGWIKNLDKMEEAKNGVMKKLEESKQGLKLPENPFGYDKLQEWQTQTVKEIESSARFHLDSIVRNLEMLASRNLTESFQGLKETLTNSEIDNLKFSDIDSKPIHVEIDPRKLGLRLPYGLKNQVEEWHEIFSATIRQKLADLLTGLHSVHSRLVGLQPLNEFEEVITEAISSLEGDIRTYFDNVHVYRSGVFAIQVRESIAKLGIEKELDQIESEFKDDYKEQVTMSAKEQLFPQINNLVALYSRRLRDLLDVCKQQRDEVKSYVFKENQASPATDLPEPDDASWYKVINEYEKEINENLNTIMKNILGELSRTLTAYGRESLKLRRSRRKRFSVMILGFWVIGLAAFLVLKFLNYLPQQTLPMMITLGTGSSVLANLIGWAVARITDKFPERVTTLKRAYEKELINNCQIITDSQLRDFRLSSLNSQAILEFIAKTWMKQVSEIKEKPAFDELLKHHDRVRENAQKFITLVNEYQATIQKMSQELMSYFSNRDSNLAKLQEISKSISTIAIEPSFNLLDTTHHDLLTVNQKIAETTFF